MSVNITRVLATSGHANHVHFGGGYLRATHVGTLGCSVSGEVEYATFTGEADVSIGPNLGAMATMQMDSSEVRSLARVLLDVADKMDAGLTMPKPVAPPTLLFTTASGDTMFMGDLDAARLLVEQDRTIHVEMVERAKGEVFWRATLRDLPDDPAEWGSGPTRQDALRYAFGAYFGPIDEFYEEDRLRYALDRGTWEGYPGDEDQS